ncbi:hypothetical protein PISMIDRAFT_407621 [Pisolithus microcarpus 441]|uniref:Uncharacterized protein n=1 Tax=Pisolithus microcarpus 441 TaxID=765257 RepID=A0A0C9Z5I8_9AGAM|nr:hypothetical protein PISMIDRAFT_407621 [Pisolithus microcarpus 441]
MLDARLDQAQMSVLPTRYRRFLPSAKQSLHTIDMLFHRTHVKPSHRLVPPPAYIFAVSDRDLSINERLMWLTVTVDVGCQH